jgi:hypothetical protein
MNGDEASVFRYFEDSISIRQLTLQEVIQGDLNPIERRVKIISRRRNLFLNHVGMNVTGDTIEIESNVDDQTEDGEIDEESKSDTQQGVSPADNVRVAKDSPREDEIIAANTVSQRHPDSEKIVLSDEIRVISSSGSRFDVRIKEVLEEEFGLVDNTDTTELSTPSMSEAAEFV